MGKMNTIRGFDVAGDASPIAVVDMPAVTRDEAVKMLAAIIAGATPREIRGFQRGGWPEEVGETLQRLGEVEELSSFVDLLAGVLVSAASTS